MKTVKTFEAKIFVGLKSGYDGETQDIGVVEQLCREFCSTVGACVTVTPTKFIYKDGHEDGAIVGLINYPRFPCEDIDIMERAKVLGKKLMIELDQYRVSIVSTSDTIMLENPYKDE